MRVVGLWRYPVKSLQGESLTSTEVGPAGIDGDREWGIRDERTGRILTARRRPQLLAAAAKRVDGVPVITLPDGSIVEGQGARTDAALSDWLSSPVSLVPSVGQDPGRAEFFADATDDSSQAIEWTMPPDRFVDAAPVLLLTTASLRAGARLHPSGTWDPRRFRPNILVERDGVGWAEDEWLGQPVRTGTATLAPTQPCIRCTMVTREQPGLAADVEVFRTLARHHRGHLGVWSDVRDAGSVTLGDPVTLGVGDHLQK